VARPRRTETAPNYQVRALQRGLAILQSFSESEPTLSMAEISRRLNLPKATTLRLLECLRQESWLAYDAERGRYALSIAALEIGSAYLAASRIEQRAMPFLRRLADLTNQTANLGILNDNNVVHVAVVEPDRPLRYHSYVGARDLAHCTGLGKVLAAYLDGPTLQALLSAGLPRRTAWTITEPDAFRQELHRVRAAGFAEDLEEGAPGLRCLAAPVLDADGSVVAAMSISGPAAEFEGSRAVFLSALLENAGGLSARLGWTTANVSHA
jgi:DNA-binding IclR family transcriptional regulator